MRVLRAWVKASSGRPFVGGWECLPEGTAQALPQCARATRRAAGLAGPLDQSAHRQMDKLCRLVRLHEAVWNRIS